WRPRMRTLNDLVAEMEAAIREIPGIEYNFSQPIRDNVNENISGQFGQIAVKIYGDDLDTLQGAAEKAEDTIAGVPGVADLGNLIPVSAVADVRMATGRAAITRENGRRYVGIRMNVRNRDMGSFVQEARARVASAVTLPPGYEITWGGEFENQERAMARLRLVIPLSLLITFLLLFSAFGSVWDCTLILLNVPFALIGGVLGLAAARMPLSVSAAVGFIALLGQAVLNGVLVVASIRGRLERGEGFYDAVVAGTRD